MSGALRYPNISLSRPDAGRESDACGVVPDVDGVSTCRETKKKFQGTLYETS